MLGALALVLSSIPLAASSGSVRGWAQGGGESQSGESQSGVSAVDEDPHIKPSGGAVALEGASLLAFDVAWKAMLKLKLRPGQQKPDLRNVTVTFNRDKENYDVHLVPHTSYTERSDGSILLEIGGWNKYGQELRYTLSRKSMEINRIQTYQ
jgi:hypothetical protein